MKENLLFLKDSLELSKNIYIDKLDDIIDKYNSHCSKIKMKPVNVKSSKYIDSSKENIDKDPKYNIGDIVRISKYKNIFARGYTPNWTKEVFVIKKNFKHCAMDICY